MSFKQNIGSKAQVYHGTAKQTSGGLKKSDLMKNKGRIVSKKQHRHGKRMYKKNPALRAQAKLMKQKWRKRTKSRRRTKSKRRRKSTKRRKSKRRKSRRKSKRKSKSFYWFL